MSLENSIAELAKAVNRYVDTVLLAQLAAANKDAGLISILPAVPDDQAPDTDARPDTTTDKPKKVKKSANGEVTHTDLKVYALKRVRETPGFRDPFLSLLSEYGAETVAELAQEHLADVSDKAKLL